MQELERIRNLINKIDRETLKILKKRISLASKTMKYKYMPYDPFREKEIMNKIPSELKTVFREIISVCRSSKKRMRVYFSNEEEFICGIHFLGHTTDFIKVEIHEKYKRLKGRYTFAMVRFREKELDYIHKRNLFIWAKFILGRKAFLLIGRRYAPENLTFPLLVMQMEKGNNKVKYKELKVKNQRRYKEILNSRKVIMGVYPEEKDD